jgi:threonylcarbamoyladenosine tRNA methylthiotransferase MtaB
MKHAGYRATLSSPSQADCAVGADVMTGFPGETGEQFEESRAFTEALPFTYLHVFTYPERPGTPAAESTAQVPMEIRKQRTHILRDLSARKNREFCRAAIGRTLSAVVLEDGRAALSGNYLKISLASQRRPNRIVDVRICGLTKDGVSEAGLLPVL